MLYQELLCLVLPCIIHSSDLCSKVVESLVQGESSTGDNFRMLPFTHANSTFSSPKPGPGGNWLDFQRPQSSSLQSGPAPTGWTNHISDQSFSNNHSHQFQPIVAQVITDMPTGFPDFSRDTITSIEPTAFPSSTLPVTQNSQNNLVLDQAIVSETHTQRNPLPSRRQASQHPRYTDDDWKKHRPTIKRLYIDQNLSLEKTMEIMSSSGFSPSLVVPELVLCW